MKKTKPSYSPLHLSRNLAKSAFSLFEVSIVILIIAMVITGFTQGDKITKRFRIKGAQSITKSSSVSAIKGLVFWIDSTSDNSFISSETSNNTNLSYWHDTNSQSTLSNNLTRTSDSHIQYKNNAINGLPAVYFDGSAISGGILTGNAIITSGNKFTFFAVTKSDDATSATSRVIFSNGSTNGFLYQKDGSDLKREVVFSGVNSSNGGSITSSAEISSAIYDGVNLEFYANGATVISSTATSSFVQPVGEALYVGSDSASSKAWKGYIAEIIIYDNALDKDERKLVENYLSKKWNIATK